MDLPDPESITTGENLVRRIEAIHNRRRLTLDRFEESQRFILPKTHLPDGPVC